MYAGYRIICEPCANRKLPCVINSHEYCKICTFVVNAFTWGSDYISTTITSLRPYPHTANAMGLHCVSDTSCWIYLLIGVYIILTSQFGFDMAQKSMPMLHTFCRHICSNASQLLKHMVLNCTLHWPMELFMFFFFISYAYASGVIVQPYSKCWLSQYFGKIYWPIALSFLMISCLSQSAFNHSLYHHRRDQIDKKISGILIILLKWAIGL